MKLAIFGIFFLLVLGVVAWHNLSPAFAILQHGTDNDDAFMNPKNIEVTPVGTYMSGIYNSEGAEIVAYDHKSQRVFVTNDHSQSIDVLDITNPASPKFEFSIDIRPYGNLVNSIDIKNQIIAAAIEPESNSTELGLVVFFDIDGNYLSHAQAGFFPDMLVFTPLGDKVLVANEGEPMSYCTGYNDPEGSVSIIDISNGVKNPIVNTVDFSKFNGQEEELREMGIRIFGPDSTATQDLEPEYITILPDSKTAAMTLQENNAVAIIDIDSAQITDLLPMGYVDYSIPENKIDASDEDKTINITNWPVKGLRQPDGIDSFVVGEDMFLITANEGDPRNYDCIVPNDNKEEEKVSNIRLDAELFPDAVFLQNDNNLGRLKVSLLEGDTDGDGDHDELFSFGARSFSIWTLDGRLVFDSADDFEQIIASKFPDHFNANHYYNEHDKRSNNRGPEPESVVVERIGAKQFAFIGLERMSGIMIYDVTDPYKPEFVDYVNNRNFDIDPSEELSGAGDLGSEGLLYIADYRSPTAKPLIVLANEVSGTTTIYEIKQDGTSDPFEYEYMQRNQLLFNVNYDE